MHLEYASAAEIPAGVWKWAHLNPATEWACHGTGKIVIETEFLDLFEKLRRMMGAPLIITSGYRSPEYNARVSESGLDGPHTHAKAIDIRIYGESAYALIRLALELGYTGVGLSQKGTLEKRFVHLDTLRRADGFARPTFWSY